MELVMARVWAAKCKSCGEMSGVRHSDTRRDIVELPAASRMTKVVCPHCKAANEFSDGELTEVNADIAQKPDLL
jgi:hypothetical protein